MLAVTWLGCSQLGSAGPRIAVPASAEIIVRHMSDEAAADEDPEGFLLATATSLDISGRDPEAWPEELRKEVVTHVPRLSLTEEFVRCFLGPGASQTDQHGGNGRRERCRRPDVPQPLGELLSPSLMVVRP